MQDKNLYHEKECIWDSGNDALETHYSLTLLFSAVAGDARMIKNGFL
jgi:hypothetical protein